MFVLFSILYDNPTHKESDAKAHYETSINLEVPKESQKTIGYHDWWERSPVYVIYLYVTKQSILLQIILSCLTVLILYKINPLAGWLFCFYPQSIILSFQFNKETLLFFVEAILFLIIYRRYKNEQR
jgi:hypothetical protein